MATDYILTANMNLTVPIVGTAPGPNWANEINACLVTVDAHDHTQGNGVQITPGGLNLNADLPFQNNNATLLRTVRLSPPSIQPALATDLNAIYAFGVDLYYRDGNGNQVRITQSGGVTGSPGNITNLAAPASVTYVGGSSSFVFQSDSNVPAVLDGASVVIRNLTANSKGLTLSAPSALAADYSIILPLKPLATSLVTMDSSGVQSTTTPDGTTIANSGGALKVPDGGISNTQAAVGFGFIPSGTILPFGGTAAPTADYLLCDGASYLRANYPNLYAAIGNAYGTADGTHFNVPDFRGQFLRGVSGASTNDPDKASRTAMATGGNSGNNVGSIQTGQVVSHTHSIALYDDTGGNGSVIKDNGNTFSAAPTATGAFGGNETRPINAYVNFLIKT